MHLFKNNKKYNIIVVNNNDTQKILLEQLIKFKKKNTMIGLDFEFKKVSKESREVALAQINLENHRKEAYIFICYPPKLSEKTISAFIDILTDDKVIKIIHGGESLDMPYIYNSIFNQNNNLFKKFLKNLYDTKFLCEYNELDKCSIYELLKRMKVIDDNQVAILEKLEGKIGPIHLIEFNISNLNNNLINYALYDVIFLPALLKKFKDIEIIQELTMINYYIKIITNYNKNERLEFNKLYRELNEINNNFIDKDNKIKLIDIYNKFKINNNIEDLLKVTYFKNFIETIIKYYVYKKTLDENIVYASNNVINKIKLNYNLNEIFLNNKNLIIKLKMI
jgi:hypothetical protein